MRPRTVSALAGFGTVAIAPLVAYRGFKWFWVWLGKGQPLPDLPEDYAAKISEPEDLPNTNLEVLHEAHEILLKQRGKGRRLTFTEVRKVLDAERQARNMFLDSFQLGWYHLVMLFSLAAAIGLVLEDVWMYATTGNTKKRYGMVWGPFIPIYGVGAVLLTAITLRLRKRHANDWTVFLTSMMVGGGLEQLTGWAMEKTMGAVSWDYIAGKVPGAITRWVAAPFLVMWGFLGFIWSRLVLPDVLWKLGKVTTKRKAVFVSGLSIYLVLDALMTLASFGRHAERQHGEPPSSAFEMWMDEHYDDEFMAERFQKMSLD